MQLNSQHSLFSFCPQILSISSRNPILCHLLPALVLVIAVRSHCQSISEWIGGEKCTQILATSCSDAWIWWPANSTRYPLSVLKMSWEEFSISHYNSCGWKGHLISNRSWQTVPAKFHIQRIINESRPSQRGYGIRHNDVVPILKTIIISSHCKKWRKRFWDGKGQKGLQVAGRQIKKENGSRGATYSCLTGTMKKGKKSSQ